MIKVLFVTIVLFGITTAGVKVMAQMKISSGNKTQNPFTDRLELKSNLRTDFHPDKNFSVEVTVINTTGKGNTVLFKTSGPVEKLTIAAFDNMSQPITPATINYAAGTTGGVCYLDAPSYEGRKFYILTFYVHGFPEQLWSTMLERKEPTPVIKLPKKKPSL